MGHITVLVQHAWAMQPSSSSKSTTNASAKQSKLAPAVIAPDRRRSATITTVPKPDKHPKPKPTLSSRIRVTIPSSVADLVRLYNNPSSKTSSLQRRACEVATRDVLARLEHLVLASTIHDPFRMDMIRLRIMCTEASGESSYLTLSDMVSSSTLNTYGGIGTASVSGSGHGSRRVRSRVPLPNASVGRTGKSFTSASVSSVTTTIPPPLVTSPIQQDGMVSQSTVSGTDSNNATASILASNKTRLFASEARLSVLMLARCRTRHIRDRSIDLLLEAIDTNLLATDDDEIQSLQYLWSELVHLFRSVIDNRRRRRAMVGGLSMMTTKQGQPYVSGLHVRPLSTSSTIATGNMPTSMLNKPTQQASYRPSHSRMTTSSTTPNIPHRADPDTITTSILEHALDTKVLIDLHLERVLNCMYLTMQRLEFIRDVRSYEFSPVMGESFQLLLEDFQLVRSDDPYVLQLIAAIDDSVHFMVSSNEEREEVMAFPIGISLLSQIVRMMPPDNLASTYESFRGIMADLNEKGQWHLGRKFIRILASAAMLNDEACINFIRFVGSLSQFNWHWQFVGILCLGAVACASQSSSIRKLALEDGILGYIDLSPTAHGDKHADDDGSDSVKNKSMSNAYHGRVPPTSAASRSNTDDNGYTPHKTDHDHTHDRSSLGIDDLAYTTKQDTNSDEYESTRTWIMRSAAVNALIEIYQQYRTQPHGLLAREIMISQRAQEPHPFVQHLLSSPAAIAPQDRAIRRLSFMFKYTCVSLAEQYAESQSDYMYLRKYVRTAERNETKRRAQKMRHATYQFGRTIGLWDQTWDTHHGDTGHGDRPQSTKTHTQNAEPIAGIHYSQMKLTEPARHSTRFMSQNQRLGLISGNSELLGSALVSSITELSVQPYHENYKRADVGLNGKKSVHGDSNESSNNSKESSAESLGTPLDPELMDPFEVYSPGWRQEIVGRDSTASGTLPPLNLPAKGSRLSGPNTTTIDLDDVHPDNGTVNRRKLFNSTQIRAKPSTVRTSKAPKKPESQTTYSTSTKKPTRKKPNSSGSSIGQSNTNRHVNSTETESNVTKTTTSNANLRVVLPTTFEEITEADETEES